jgi:2-aminoadipate transaminase
MLTSTTALQDQTCLASSAKMSNRSAMREMLALVTSSDLLSFALGLPAPELLPLAACRAAAGQALAAPQALQYQMSPESLKRHLRELMASRGVSCREDQIFLTTGAQQAIHLLVNLLLNRGMQVFVEEVTYEGAHMAIQPLQPQVLTVPAKVESGMDIDAVESMLLQGARPACLYAITDGHNPLGISLSQVARTRLVELAKRFRVPIIEDDVFGFLNYDGLALSPMRALDEDWVFYVGSFSKILAPALRVGWIVAPDAFKSALSSLKQASDLDLTTLAQLTVSTYLDSGNLPDHLAALRREYSLRRDTMLSAIESHFPLEAKWKKPGSGMFIWVELPPEINTVELLKIAVETERVAFMPGAIFATPGQSCARNGIRLNFTLCSPERIEAGMAKLARALKKSLTRDK